MKLVTTKQRASSKRSTLKKRKTKNITTKKPITSKSKRNPSSLQYQQNLAFASSNKPLGDKKAEFRRKLEKEQEGMYMSPEQLKMDHMSTRIRQAAQNPWAGRFENALAESSEDAQQLAEKVVKDYGNYYRSGKTNDGGDDNENTKHRDHQERDQSSNNMGSKWTALLRKKAHDVKTKLNRLEHKPAIRNENNELVQSFDLTEEQAERIVLGIDPPPDVPGLSRDHILVKPLWDHYHKRQKQFADLEKKKTDLIDVFDRLHDPNYEPNSEDDTVESEAMIRQFLLIGDDYEPDWEKDEVFLYFTKDARYLWKRRNTENLEFGADWYLHLSKMREVTKALPDGSVKDVYSSQGKGKKIYKEGWGLLHMQEEFKAHMAPFLYRKLVHNEDGVPPKDDELVSYDFIIYNTAGDVIMSTNYHTDVAQYAADIKTNPDMRVHQVTEQMGRRRLIWGVAGFEDGTFPYIGATTSILAEMGVGDVVECIVPWSAQGLITRRPNEPGEAQRIIIKRRANWEDNTAKFAQRAVDYYNARKNTGQYLSFGKAWTQRDIPDAKPDNIIFTRPMYRFLQKATDENPEVVRNHAEALSMAQKHTVLPWIPINVSYAAFDAAGKRRKVVKKANIILQEETGLPPGVQWALRYIMRPGDKVELILPPHWTGKFDQEGQLMRKTPDRLSMDQMHEKKLTSQIDVKKQTAEDEKKLQILKKQLFFKRLDAHKFADSFKPENYHKLDTLDQDDDDDNNKTQTAEEKAEEELYQRNLRRDILIEINYELQKNPALRQLRTRGEEFQLKRELARQRRQGLSTDERKKELIPEKQILKALKRLQQYEEQGILDDFVYELAESITLAMDPWLEQRAEDIKLYKRLEYKLAKEKAKRERDPKFQINPTMENELKKEKQLAKVREMFQQIETTLKESHPELLAKLPDEIPAEDFERFRDDPYGLANKIIYKVAKLSMQEQEEQQRKIQKEQEEQQQRGNTINSFTKPVTNEFGWDKQKLMDSAQGKADPTYHRYWSHVAKSVPSPLAIMSLNANILKDTKAKRDELLQNGITLPPPDYGQDLIETYKMHYKTLPVISQYKTEEQREGVAALGLEMLREWVIHKNKTGEEIDPFKPDNLWIKRFNTLLQDVGDIKDPFITDTQRWVVELHEIVPGMTDLARDGGLSNKVQKSKYTKFPIAGKVDII